LVFTAAARSAIQEWLIKLSMVNCRDNSTLDRFITNLLSTDVTCCIEMELAFLKAYFVTNQCSIS